MYAAWLPYNVLEDPIYKSSDSLSKHLPQNNRHARIHVVRRRPGVRQYPTVIVFLSFRKSVDDDFPKR